MSETGLVERTPGVQLALLPESKVANTSGFTPKGNRVLVRPKQLDQKTAGGIVIPELAHEKEQMAQVYGVVVAIGPYAWEGQEPWAAVGETVLFGRYRGADVKGKDGITYRIMNDVEIVATFEE